MHERCRLAMRRVLMVGAAALLMSGFAAAAGGDAGPPSTLTVYAQAKDNDRLPSEAPATSEEESGEGVSLRVVIAIILIDLIVTVLAARIAYQRGRASVKAGPNKATVRKAVEDAVNDRLKEAERHDMNKAMPLLEDEREAILAALKRLGLVD